MSSGDISGKEAGRNQREKEEGSPCLPVGREAGRQGLKLGGTFPDQNLFLCIQLNSGRFGGGEGFSPGSPIFRTAASS